MDKLYKLLCHEKRAVKQEAAWIVSNLLTGTVDQIDMVIKLPGMVDRLMHMSNKEDTYVSILYFFLKEVIINLNNSYKKTRYGLLAMSQTTEPFSKFIVSSKQGLSRCL